MKRILGTVILILAIALAGTGCGSTTTSSSSGGASLTFGLNVDQTIPEITDPSTTFPAQTEIYYLFNNNEPFGNKQLTIRLTDAATDEVLLEQSYDVGAENSIYINTVGFNNPGKYNVLMVIDGKTRAQQELIIQ